MTLEVQQEFLEYLGTVSENSSPLASVSAMFPWLWTELNSFVDLIMGNNVAIFRSEYLTEFTHVIDQNI